MSQDSADKEIEKSYGREREENCVAEDKEVGNGGEDDKDSRMSLGEDKERPSASEEDDDQEYQYQSEEEEIVISQNEFLNLQTFKNICFNIRENLDMIRSYKKEIAIFPSCLFSKYCCFCRRQFCLTGKRYISLSSTVH